MTLTEELHQSITGVLRLFRFDATALTCFGRDAAAAKRSFWAWAFAVPALTIVIWLGLIEAKPEDPGLYVAARMIAQIIEIVGFPLLMLGVAGFWERRAAWPVFVTAYNWFAMLQISLQITALSLSADGGPAVAGLVLNAVLVYTLLVEAFLAQTTLGIGRFQAISVVILDVVFGELVDNAARYVAGVPFHV